MALLFRIGGGSDQTTTGFQRARTTAGRHPPMMWCVFTVSFWVGGWLGGGRRAPLAAAARLCVIVG